MRFWTPIAAVTLLLFLLPPGVARAQLPDAAIGAIFFGVAGTKIVDKLEEKFQSINSQAISTLNLASGNALILAESAIQGLRQLLRTEREQLFQNLDNQRKNIVFDIYRLLDNIERRVEFQRAYLKVDMTDLMNNVMFLTDKVDFLVTAINPVTVLWRNGGDYNIDVVGVGVGSPANNQNYSVAVNFDGAQIPGDQIAQYPSRLAITIPYAALGPRFKERGAPITIPLEIISTRVRGCGFLRLSNCETSYKLTFPIKLYPRYGGDVVVEQVVPTQRLVDQRTEYTVFVSSPDRHNKPEVTIYSPPMSAAPGWRITSAYYDEPSCRGRDNACVFFSNPVCSIQQEGRVAQCSVSQGSHPKDFRFRYVVARETEVPVPLPNSSSIELGVGEPRAIPFRRSASVVNLQVRLADGRSGRFSLRPGDINPIPLIRCGPIADLGTEVAQSECVLTIPN